jgi:hypothetical protein
MMPPVAVSFLLQRDVLLLDERAQAPSPRRRAFATAVPMESEMSSQDAYFVLVERAGVVRERHAHRPGTRAERRQDRWSQAPDEATLERKPGLARHVALMTKEFHR